MFLPQGLLTHPYRWCHVSLSTVAVLLSMVLARIILLWGVMNGGPGRAANFGLGESSTSAVAVFA